MKLIYLFGVLSLFLFTSCSTKVVMKEPEVKMVSGLIGASSADGKCELTPAERNKSITCKITHSKEKNLYLIELDGSSVFKNSFPTCLFEGMTHTTKDGVLASKKIETRTTLISTSQIWVELPGYKKSAPQDMIAQFICTY